MCGLGGDSGSPGLAEAAPVMPTASSATTSDIALLNLITVIEFSPTIARMDKASRGRSLAGRIIELTHQHPASPHIGLLFPKEQLN